MEIMGKFGWYAFLIAMTGDILVSSLLPLFYKEYSVTKTSISALGNPKSPVRVPFNVWMFTEGLLFLAAIPAFYSYYREISGWLTYTTIIFIAVFAIGACIFTGFFSVNESKDIVTTASRIHGVGSVAGFILFLFVPLMLAVLSFKGCQENIGIVCVACFAAAMIFFVLFVMSDKPELSNTVVNNEGLWERLNLLFMYTPLLLISVSRLMEI